MIETSNLVKSVATSEGQLTILKGISLKIAKLYGGVGWRLAFWFTECKSGERLPVGWRCNV